MAKCVSKHGYQKDIMCLKEIGRSDQNLWTILCSIMNRIGFWGGGGVTWLFHGSGTYDLKIDSSNMEINKIP